MNEAEFDVLIHYIDAQHAEVMDSISELRSDVNSLREFRGSVKGMAKGIVVVASVISFCVSIAVAAISGGFL